MHEDDGNETGQPSQSFIKAIRRNASDYALNAMSRFKDFEKRDWFESYPRATPEALDLLDKMLAFDPEDRITMEEALEHSYFSSLHDTDDEPSFCGSIITDFEDKGSVSLYRCYDVEYCASELQRRLYEAVSVCNSCCAEVAVSDKCMSSPTNSCYCDFTSFALQER